MSDEKKIIIDEDWKAQVEAEREEARQAKGPAEESPGPGAAGDPAFPPASFDLLLTTLATETMVALGRIPHPATGKPEIRRNHAKYLIDTIDVLREKTKGNLTPEEGQGIETLLHQLRLMFVETGTHAAAGDKPSDAPASETPPPGEGSDASR